MLCPQDDKQATFKMLVFLNVVRIDQGSAMQENLKAGFAIQRHAAENEGVKGLKCPKKSQNTFKKL